MLRSSSGKNNQARKSRITLKPRLRTAMRGVYIATGAFIVIATIGLMTYFQFAKVNNAYAATSTQLAEFEFESNMTVDASAIGSPTMTYSATPSYVTGGVSGDALEFSSTGQYLEITMSTINYSNITIQWSGKATNAGHLSATVALSANSGSGYGSTLYTYTFSSTSWTTSTSTTLSSTFNNNSQIKIKIYYTTDGKNDDIDDIIIKGTQITSSTNYFRAQASGSWKSISTWQSSSDNSTWVSAGLIPDSGASTITIAKGDTVTVTANVIADQLVVDSGGTLVIDSSETLTIANSTGTDLSVSGTVQVNNDGFISESSGATVTFNANSVFVLNWTTTALISNVIPKATWDPTSTVEITGITTATGNTIFGQDQQLGNVIYNCPNQTSAFSLYYTFMSTNIVGDVHLQGNLTILSTGTGSLAIGSSTASNQVIDGNLIVEGGTWNATSSGARTLTVEGNVSMTAGTWNLTTGGGNYTLNVGGNYSFTGGTISSSSTGIDSVYFDGSGTQTYTSGGTYSTAVNFTVKSGATLSMGTSILSGSGTFTLSSGAGLAIGSTAGITSSGATGNIQVTGTRSFNGGANYTYSGTSAQSTGAGLPTTITGNLTINNSNGVTLTLATSLSSPDTLFLTSGTFTTASGLTLTSTGTTVSRTAGIMSAAPTVGTSFNLIYSGSTAVTTGKEMPSSATQINNLTINNSDGITLNNNVTVNGTLTFTAGIVTTNSYQINVANTATTSITGYSSTSYVNGNLDRYVSSSGSYDFPLGTTANYEFANITLSSITGFTNILGSFTNSNPISALLPLTSLLVNGTTINGMLNYGYWTLTPNTTITGGSYTVTIKEKGHTNSASSPSAYCVLKRHDATSSWQSLGTTVNSTQSEVNGVATMVCSELTSFSQYGGGMGGGALPIELISFNAQFNTDHVDLAWSTASEINNDYFTISRSADGVNYDEVLRKPGAGTSTKELDYTAIDDAPLQGISYYRLTQTDYNGHFVDFPPKAVEYGVDKNQANITIKTVGPNPFKSNFNINYSVANQGQVDIQISNSSGQLVYKETTNADKGFNTWSFTDMQGLPPGVYIVNLVCDGEAITEKLVKQ